MVNGDASVFKAETTQLITLLTAAVIPEPHYPLYLFHSLDRMIKDFKTTNITSEIYEDEKVKLLIRTIGRTPYKKAGYFRP